MRPGLKTLRTIPVLARLREAVLEEVDAVSEVISIDRGTQLFRQGTLPVVLYFVLDGLMALSSAVPDGSTAVVDVVRPMGDLVLASVVGALPYLQSAHAVTRARLVAIDAALVRKLVEREPALAGPLLMSVARDVRGLVRHVRDLKLRTAAQRLGAFLLGQVEDPGARRAEFRLPFEKGLLAARLGCRQENLSRAFATLRDYGVETHGSQVILHSIQKLTAYAVPDYLNDPELTKPPRARPAGARRANARASA
ncbi:MAG: helix-turn-helix domain-containing protein [Rhodospirillales bacterium]|jgi:CRP/FNR family transcriptional activator FtrB|nr:helix-turn-helix domain-containing protein [Rhodospirillales bacterium]